LDTRNRREKIIEALINDKDYVTSQRLSYITGVSPRTIREDIKGINTEFLKDKMEIESVPGKGYFLNDFVREELSKTRSAKLQKQYFLPVLPEERVQYIIKKLIFNEKHVASDTIADELYVSKSTIENDLLNVDRFIREYHLKLDRKPAFGTKIMGDELDKRMAMVGLVMTSSPIKWEEVSDRESVEWIRGIVADIEKQYKFNVSNDDYNRLNVYLCIAKDRLKERREILSEKVNFISQELVEYQIARDIVREIKKVCGFTFPAQEINVIARLLAESEIFEITSARIMSYQADDVNLVKSVEDIIRKINDIYKIDLFDQKIVSDIVILFEGLMFGGKYKNNIRNVDVKRIKEEYPSAIEMSIMIAMSISEEYELVIVEENIIDLALILATMIEKKKMEQAEDMKNVAIISSSGIGGSELLELKLRYHFPNINLLGVFPEYRLYEVEKKNPDFILSMTAMQCKDIPVLQTSAILTNRDIANINKLIEKQNSQEDGATLFANLFQKDLFVNEMDLDDRTKVIELLCERMQKGGYVDGDYKKRVFEREEITSTVIGNLLAIPHGISTSENKNTICVGILKKPINWLGEKVQIVFLLNITDTSNRNFKKLYEKFFEIISTKNKMKKLIKSKDFEEFMTEIKK
jgi:lichenan operon transcriptional antiterminator